MSHIKDQNSWERYGMHSSKKSAKQCLTQLFFKYVLQVHHTTHTSCSSVLRSVVKGHFNREFMLTTWIKNTLMIAPEKTEDSCN